MSQGVVVLDDDEDLRQTVAEVAEMLSGEPSLGVASFADLVRASEFVLGSRLVILDINLGAGVPSGLDAFRWLRSQSYRGRVVFLTGHARSHPATEEARRLSDARVLEKPVAISVLDALIKEARA
jgi:FixJ family two-component response regulator